MKNGFRLLGIIAAAASIILGMAACDNGSTGTSGVTVDNSLNGGNYTGNVPQKWQGTYTGGTDKTVLSANSAVSTWAAFGNIPQSVSGLSVSLGGEIKLLGSTVVGEYVYLYDDNYNKIGILTVLDNKLAGAGTGYWYRLGYGYITSPGNKGVPYVVADVTQGGYLSFDPPVDTSGYNTDASIGGYTVTVTFDGSKGTTPTVP